MERYSLDYRSRPTTTVKFGLHGDGLEPQSVTDALGVPPSEAWAKGDQIQGSNPARPQTRRTGAWILESRSSKYDAFDQQLSHLLDQLEAMPLFLRRLIDEFEGGVAVAYSSGEQHIGFVIGRSEMQRLCRLGLATSFSIYPISADD